MQGIPETRVSLILRLRQPGNQEAWQEFAALYESLIYRLAARKGMQHADAQDLLQDVLVAVSKGIDRLCRKIHNFAIAMSIQFHRKRLLYNLSNDRNVSSRFFGSKLCLTMGACVSTTTITPYLFFAGRCEEALDFYRKSHGAQIDMLMRFNDCPDPVPPAQKQE